VGVNVNFLLYVESEYAASLNFGQSFKKAVDLLMLRQITALNELFGDNGIARNKIEETSIPVLTSLTRRRRAGRE